MGEALNEFLFCLVPSDASDATDISRIEFKYIPVDVFDQFVYAVVLCERGEEAFEHFYEVFDLN